MAQAPQSPPAPPEITLRLALDDINLPFARVFALVSRIQGQAAEQLKAASAADPAQ